MTHRAQELMQQIWLERNNGADTETKLVAAIIRKSAQYVKTMTAKQLNNLQVLNKDDMMELAKEIQNLP